MAKGKNLGLAAMVLGVTLGSTSCDNEKKAGLK